MKKETPKEKSVTPVIIQKKELVLEGDPQAQLTFAKKAADALMEWVKQKPKKVMIRGEQFLEFGDWQIIGRFYGSTVGIEWTKPINKGWEARAQVYRNSEIIASAEAMCTRDEKNWKDRDEFMLKSMAQTRASAKALRQAFGWVAELAGMRSTPAEEMGDQFDTSPVKEDVVPTVSYDDHESGPVKKAPTNTGTLAGNTRVASDKPWQQKPKAVATELQLKKKIKDLADQVVMVPLEGTEYKEWIESITGLELVTSNYQEIITRLEALK